VSSRAACTAAALVVAGSLHAACAVPAGSRRNVTTTNFVAAPITATEDARGKEAPPPRRAPAPKRSLAPEARGVVHVVKKGETAWRIARTYGLTADELLRANGIEGARDLKVGAALLVPGASEPRPIPKPGEPFAAPPPSAAAPAPTSTAARAPVPAPAARSGTPIPAPGAVANLSIASRRGTFSWPLQGVLYSRFGPRSGHRHDGIDVSAPDGTAVLAAGDGEVVFAGEQAGYGSIVILRHAGGLVTVYAHASALLVREGAAVKRGEGIARVGQTGRTSGPHLHFEVREGTRPRDPLLFLP
jgi:lipoprotein NlpD